MGQGMKLGLHPGHWDAQPPDNNAELVITAEVAGYDTVFTAATWGSDAYTPLTWWNRQTQPLRLGTSVVQMSMRTPTACVMAALTLSAAVPDSRTPSPSTVLTWRCERARRWVGHGRARIAHL